MPKLLHTTLPDVYYKNFVGAEHGAWQELLDLGIADDDVTDDLIAEHINSTMTALSDEWWTNIRYLCPPHGKPYYWLVVADLGLWNGRRRGCRVFRNLQDALFACIDKMDDYTITEDQYGVTVIYGYHHDGYNVYRLYRLSDRGVSRYRRGVYSIDVFAENPRYRTPARLSKLMRKS